MMFFHKLTRFFNETTELNIYTGCRTGRQARQAGEAGQAEGRASMTKRPTLACLRPVAEHSSPLCHEWSPSDHLSTWIKGFRRYGSRLASDCYCCWFFFSLLRSLFLLLSAFGQQENPQSAWVRDRFVAHHIVYFYNFAIKQKKKWPPIDPKKTVQCVNYRTTARTAALRTRHVRIIIHNIFIRMCFALWQRKSLSEYDVESARAPIKLHLAYQPPHSCPPSVDWFHFDGASVFLL